MSIFYSIRTEETCACHWASWRDAKVCDMHLKAGYGKWRQYATAE